MATIGKLLTKIFGSRNDRLLKRYQRIVDQINAMEPKVQAMSDEQLRARTLELHLGLTAGPKPSDKPTLKPADVMPEAFAIIREAMDRNIGIRTIFNPEEGEFVVKFDPSRLDDKGRRLYDEVQQRLIATGESYLKVPIPVELYAAVRKAYPESRPPFRARPFDVQIIGGLVLYEGRIAEMATGEGKTFVAPLACFMRVLEGYHCHVVTVNDYLVKRDANWIRPAFEALGLSRRLHPVGHGAGRRRPPQAVRVRRHLRHQQRVRLRLPARQHEGAARTCRCRARWTSRSWTRWTRS